MSPEQKAERQKKILAGLLAALLVVFVWRVGVPAFQSWLDQGAASRQASKRAARTASITKKTIDRVRIEDLQREGATYRPKRNIFRYAPPKAVPPPPPPPRLPPPPPREPPPPPPPAVEPEEQPPPVEFKVLGLFGPEARRIAVLIDGPEIINARVSDVVKDDFVVQDIGFEVVDIGFVRFPDAEPVRLEIEGKSARRGGGGSRGGSERDRGSRRRRGR